jgi:hypothetical protein
MTIAVAILALCGFAVAVYFASALFLRRAPGPGGDG